MDAVQPKMSSSLIDFLQGAGSCVLPIFGNGCVGRLAEHGFSRPYPENVLLLQLGIRWLSVK